MADRGQYQPLPLIDMSLAGQGHSKYALKCIQVRLNITKSGNRPYIPTSFGWRIDNFDKEINVAG